jgi:predicted permease
MHIAQDIRQGLRALKSRPLFSIVAIVALSLGIGANSAIFSVVNAVLLQPLSYPDSDRIVSVLHQGARAVAPANYFDWREENQSFSAITATQWWEPTLSGDEYPEQVRALQANGDIFDVFGVTPALGRGFLPGEDLPGKDRVVVLGNGLWQRRFGANRNVLGSTLSLNGESYIVIGVMPTGHEFVPFWASEAELLTPVTLADRRNDRGGQSLRVFARLADGTTQERAQSEMAGIMSVLASEDPKNNAGLTVHVVPVIQNVVGDIQPVLLALLGAVGFVLLIACTNVANLLLGRAVTRRKEIAIRMAVGANRSRVIQQLLTESLLLSGLGGLGGLMLALWGIDVLGAMSPASIPRVESIQLDTSVVLFTISVSLLTGLLFGLIPAVQTSSTDMSEVMNEDARGSAEGGSRSRLRSALIVSEVALTLMLLIGAGLMLRSFTNLQNIDPGFDDKNLLTMTVSVAGSRYAEGPRRSLFFQETIDQVGALPGITTVSAINHLPLNGDLWGLSLSFEGRPVPDPEDQLSGTYRVVFPDFFKTMGIPLMAGRDFSERDVLGVPGVAMINENMAQREFAGENPLGRRIAIGNRDNPEWLTVVGVTGNVRQGSWVEENRYDVYVPYLQTQSYLEEASSGYQYMTLVAKTSGPPMDLAAAVSKSIWQVDKNVPVSQITSMSKVVADQLWQPRFSMFLFSVFAAVALTLAAIGIYGVMAYSVSQRTREIGIRMALGAGNEAILNLILARGIALTAIGTVIGLILTTLLVGVMSDLVYGINVTDPITFIAGSLVLFGVALLSCYIPARRAVRVNPVTALKYQ